MKRTAAALAFISLFFLGFAGTPAAGAAETITFEQAVSDLKSPDVEARFRAAALLKDAAYPEAAVPLADAVNDKDDAVQVEAIGAELNIFLAEKVSSRRRVAFVIERRGKIMADAAFAGGRSVVGPRVVPCEVGLALVRALHDDNPEVALDALYAFGTLAPEVAASDRPELLRSAAPNLASLLGAPYFETRQAALHVIERVYTRRAGDEAVDQTLGDTIIGALNDKSTDMRIGAMQALGAMRYDRAVKALTELFQYYKRGSMAENALDALARIGSPASASLFAVQLTVGNTTMKTIAIEGLARVGDPAASANIQAATSADRNDSLLLASAFASASLANGSIQTIVEALSRPKLRGQALSYLVELAPGRQRQFAEGSQDPDPRIRADIADVLGIGADPAALPVVDAMAHDRDPLAARAAERAVARLRAAR